MLVLRINYFYLIAKDWRSEAIANGGATPRLPAVSGNPFQLLRAPLFVAGDRPAVAEGENILMEGAMLALFLYRPLSP
ncbi:hypothetical protein [Pseudoduganella umbonata]|uniref:Uncharacterized protein n=1 Tax=Pseudoduganella umbonata TaxID=864828 RepID=A0A4P8HL95_9BURK|nr:hypothetical protein [Pseudoduganella umbonata]MBB3221301.1 hypothetical protein [Pseudoduganella umbonata]QCP10473.1 hypothetical protein FCL38_08555 [Pseudoduganella umbonata]